MIKEYLSLAAFVIVLAFIVGFSTTALAEEFYAGKTIRVVVGTSPGGGFDRYTRAIARHIGNFIPGSPTPIVENMPGAASLTAANTMYNKAKPDGLTVWIWNSGLVLRQALGDRRVKFDARKVGWIGAPSVGMPSCAVMVFTGLKTLEDVINSKKPLKMGASRAGQTPADLPKILNLTIGTKFEVISGMRGSRRLQAMQKREVDGVCFGWESMRTTARSMLDASGDDKLIPILTHRNPKDPEVKDLPQLRDVVKAKAGEEGTAILNAWLGPHEFMRQLSVPPGTPKDRLLTLRKAFKATLKAPEFLADAKKSKLLIMYVSGEQIEKFVDQILAISPKTKKSLQFLVGKKKKKIS
jgi:tripartite-type tricarboxylate transporter receptor subunit TctC